MFPITQYSLDKLETLLREMGYKVRYEKGNFKTGACVLQSTRVVVVNKFYSLEAKIQALTELLRGLQTDSDKLTEKQKHFLEMIKQTKLTI